MGSDCMARVWRLMLGVDFLAGGWRVAGWVQFVVFLAGLILVVSGSVLCLLLGVLWRLVVCQLLRDFVCFVGVVPCIQRVGCGVLCVKRLVAK